MASAGTVSVEVEGKADSLPDVIQSALDSVDTTVEIEANASAAQAEVDSLDGGVIEAEVDASTATAQAEIDALEGDTIETEVTADTSQAEASITSLGETAGSTGSEISALGEGAGGAGGGLDSFGGAAVGASDALGGLGAGVLAGGAAFGYFVGEAAEAQRITAETDQLLETTGAGAFTTSEHISELAGTIRDYSGQSDEAVQHGSNLLLTFAGINNEASLNAGILDRATVATADIATLMGGDASGAALRLGRALDDPVRGMTALQRSGVSFTAAQKETIRALAESGDMLGAQKALLDVVEGQVGGVARAYGQTFAGQLDIAKEKLGDLAEVGGSDVLPVLTDIAKGAENAADGFGALSAAAGESTDLTLGKMTLLGTGLEQFGNVISNPLGGEGVVSTIGKNLVDFGTAADQASREVQELATDLNGLMAEVFGVTNAEDAFTQAQFALLDSLGQNGSAIEGNTLAAIANRQGLQSLVTTTAQRVAQLRSQDAGEMRIAQAQREGISVINTMAARYGWTRAQVQNYTRAILDIPEGASTKIVAQGLADASSRLGNFLATLKEFDGKTYTAYVETIGDLTKPFASGTPSAPPGLAWVGEEGPELIALGGGERIWSHSESVRMASAAPVAAGESVTNVIVVQSIDDAMGLLPADSRGKVRRRFLAGAF